MTDGTSLATDGLLVRYPTWGCRCGSDGNFCSRGQCRNCGATAPARIRKLANNEISKRKKQVKQNNGKSHARGDALPKLSDILRTCRKSCTPEGIQEKRTTSLKSPRGPKGCPNECGQSRCKQVSLHRHQLNPSIWCLSSVCGCIARNVQLISRRLRRSLR